MPNRLNQCCNRSKTARRPSSFFPTLSTWPKAIRLNSGDGNAAALPAGFHLPIRSGYFTPHASGLCRR